MTDLFQKYLYLQSNFKNFNTLISKRKKKYPQILSMPHLVTNKTFLHRNLVLLVISYHSNTMIKNASSKAAWKKIRSINQTYKSGLSKTLKGRHENRKKSGMSHTISLKNMRACNHFKIRFYMTCKRCCPR